jgi:ABC-2 type transport system ATP-binding protein
MVNNYRVREMLEYVAWMKGVAKRERGEAIERVAHECDVTRFLSHRVSALSGGTLRRVGIAQSIVNSPKVIILDEPTAGLDIVQQGQLYEVVRRLARAAVVVISTHSSSDVSEMGESVTVFNNGVSVFSGTVEDLAVSDARSRREGLEEGYRTIIGDSTKDTPSCG